MLIFPLKTSNFNDILICYTGMYKSSFPIHIFVSLNINISLTAFDLCWTIFVLTKIQSRDMLGWTWPRWDPRLHMSNDEWPLLRGQEGKPTK